MSACNACVFFVPRISDDPEDDFGICKRYPPVLAEIPIWNGIRHYRDDDPVADDSVWQGLDMPSMYVFPRVESDDWCGEFKEKPAVEDEDGDRLKARN